MGDRTGAVNSLASRLGHVPSGIEPAEALLAEVARSVAAVEFYDDLVKTIEPESILDDRSIDLIDQWNTQRSKMVEISSLVVRAGIAERALQLEEQKAALITAIIIEVLADPGVSLTRAQQDEVRRAMARKMRAIETTAA